MEKKSKMPTTFKATTLVKKAPTNFVESALIQNGNTPESFSNKKIQIKKVKKTK